MTVDNEGLKGDTIKSNVYVMSRVCLHVPAGTRLCYNGCLVNSGKYSSSKGAILITISIIQLNTQLGLINHVLFHTVHCPL